MENQTPIPYQTFFLKKNSDNAFESVSVQDISLLSQQLLLIWKIPVVTHIIISPARYMNQRDQQQITQRPQ